MDISVPCLVLAIIVVFSLYLVLRLNPGVVDTRVEDGVGPSVGRDCEGVVAIDLGTAFSSVAVFTSDTVTIIPNEHGKLRTPSYVAFNENGEPFVGDEAKAYSTIEPERVVFDVMRFLGRKQDNFLKSQERFYPFDITTNNQGGVRLRVKVKDRSVSFAPEEILALILKRMKDIAESFLKKPVQCAVVSVPAVFLQAQRHAVKDAGMIAGLRIVRLPNTPSISAVGYMNTGSRELSSLGETSILVYYLGAGSCDVSLMTVSSSVIDVTATEGTKEIGSEDVIHRIMQHYLSMNNEVWTALRDSDLAVQRLRREVERALMVFIAEDHTSTTIVVQNSQGQTIVRDELTRTLFNQLCEEVLTKTMKHARRMLKEAKDNGMKVKDILLLGGGTRITRLRYIIQSAFPGMIVIPGEAAVGENKVRGLALHGAIIQHQIKSPILLDVTSYPIGMFASKANITVIRQFSPLPFQKTAVYGTAEDNQENIGTTFYEGHSPKPGENLMAFSLVVDKLRRGPAGIGRIEIEYELSADGLLQVYAREINNRKAVTSLKPKNILLDQDIGSIFTRWEKLLKRSEIYIARVNGLLALERCVYAMMYLCSNKPIGDDSVVDTLSRIIRGHIKWLQRSDHLDPINFQDQKHKLKNSLRNILTEKTCNKFSIFC